MQLTMDQAMGRGFLLFARRSGGYVMRSEKRPGQGGAGHRGRKPRRPKAGIFYIIMTIIISVILWPVGMVMLWRKKVRMQTGTKLLISLLTMCMCIFLIVFALTVHVDNDSYTEFQDRANDWLNKATTQLAVYGDAAYQKGLETWGVMTEFAGNAVGPVANTSADLLDRAVVLSCEARSKLQNVPLEEILPEELSHLAPTQDKTAEAADADGELSIYIPENTPDPETAVALQSGLMTSEGEVRPDETPEPTDTPAPTATPSPTPEPTEAPISWSAVDESATLEPEVTDTPEPRLMAAAEVEPVQDAEATEAPEASPSEASPSPAPTTTPTATPEPTPEGTQAPVTAKAAAEATVYYNTTGSYYHMGPTCALMTSADPHTLGEAIVDGKQRCETCLPPEASILQEAYVVWVDEDQVYHVTDECEKFKGGWTLISLNDAVDGEYTPCPDCRADVYTRQNAEKAAEAVTPTPEPTPTPVAPSATLKPAGDAIVYHSSNGRFYHRREICQNMTGSSPYKLSEITSAYRRCTTCDAPDVAMVGQEVLWIDGNDLCHTSDECEAFSGDYNFILPEEARSRGLSGCPACGGDQYLQ